MNICKHVGLILKKKKTFFICTIVTVPGIYNMYSMAYQNTE